jgi:hypothetical protein
MQHLKVAVRYGQWKLNVLLTCIVYIACVLCRLAATMFAVGVHLVDSTILFMESSLLLVSFSDLTGG